jgi:hypothetical protein
MSPHARDIPGIAAAQLEICLVAVERFRNR